ncbi:hypothetical protein [Micromonospora sp. NPDC005806]|uniref:hypothetical protein n=1 Tax=Micromonospora sp. NPDC005806 TaxID=3364234 RepID=UPI00369E4196
MNRNRVWGWLLLALLATLVAGGWLLVSDLLWTVPAPRLVLAAVLAVTAAPGLVAWRRRGDRWPPVVTFLVAALVGVGVVQSIEPSTGVVARVLAEIPVPPDMANPIDTSGCRWCVGLLSPPPAPHADRGVVTTDPDRLCREIVAQAQRSGWTLRGWTDAPFGAYLTRPAPFGAYGLEVTAYESIPGSPGITQVGDHWIGPAVWLTVIAHPPRDGRAVPVAGPSPGGR